MITVQGGNFFLSKALAHGLGRLMAKQSVLDLGCGLGQYGGFFREHYPGVRWVGVDGAANVEEVTKGRVAWRTSPRRCREASR